MFNKVIDIAAAEVGYLEKRSLSQLDEKTANAGSNNYTKYWRDMAPGMQGQPYCNAFVNWCFVKAFGENVAKKLLCTDGAWSYYTPTSAGYFKAKGQYYKSNPKVGDIIYFKNTERICHVGIVYKVDSTRVYTIEGNTSGGSTLIANGGGVAKKSYPLGYSRIDGYGRPNYGEKKDTIVFFDEQFYKRVYSDVKGLSGSQLLDHYVSHGIKEGRVPSPAFDPKWYLENNADLKNVFKTDYKAAYEHFCKHGIKEGRESSFVFGISEYRSANPDIKAVLGKDWEAYLRHFMTYGCKEFRKTSGRFDIRKYKKKNPDLAAAFKDDAMSYYIHWYTNGYKENRIC